MRGNSTRADWFFPIEEATICATLTRNGEPRNVSVDHKKALVAAAIGHIFSSNTMTDITSRPPQSLRFLRDRPTLVRRTGARFRDFSEPEHVEDELAAEHELSRIAASRPGFSVAYYLERLSESAAAGSFIHR